MQDYPQDNSPQLVIQYQQPYNSITNDQYFIIRMSKTIKLFTLIDIIFSIINAFISPILFIIAIFPVIGWIGATNFNKWFVLIYGFYLILENILKGYILGISASFIISIIFTLLIFSYVVYFIKTIWNLSQETLNDLKIWAERPEMKLCGFI